MEVCLQMALKDLRALHMNMSWDLLLLQDGRWARLVVYFLRRWKEDRAETSTPIHPSSDGQ